MKVILLKSHENMGNVGDVVNVKNGYARNFLIPNKIASPATEKNIKDLNLFIKAQEIKEAKDRTNMELLLKQLNKLTIKLSLQAGGAFAQKLSVPKLPEVKPPLAYTVPSRSSVIV